MDYQDTEAFDYSKRKEKARKKIVKLVFIIYFIYIFKNSY